MLATPYPMADLDQRITNEAQVLDWLAEVFQQPRGEISVETARRDVPTWDSLGVLTLMAELDEKFDLVLSDQDMQAMNKIGDIIVVLRTHGKLAP